MSMKQMKCKHLLQKTKDENKIGVCLLMRNLKNPCPLFISIKESLEKNHSEAIVVPNGECPFFYYDEMFQCPSFES